MMILTRSAGTSGAKLLILSINDVYMLTGYTDDPC
jgi:hypothetical protein